MAAGPRPSHRPESGRVDPSFAARLLEDSAGRRRPVSTAARGEGPAMVNTSEDGAATLSPAERRILELVADGLTNAQIARQLWVTEATIKFHLSRIYRKLGVTNRTAAAMWLRHDT
jgi:DNA-binding NarL/FixJ family response regulator